MTSNSVGHKQHCSCLDLDDNNGEIGTCSDDAAATVSLSADIESSNDDDIDVQSKNDRLMDEANSCFLTDDELFWLSIELEANERMYLFNLFISLFDSSTALNAYQFCLPLLKLTFHPLFETDIFLNNACFYELRNDLISHTFTGFLLSFFKHHFSAMCLP